MVALNLGASAIWGLLSYAAFSENNVTLLLVALIGAGSSLLGAFWSRGIRKDLNQVRKDRRVVVTKTGTSVTVTDEELDDLAE